MARTAFFIFYGSLNDFLSSVDKKRVINYEFSGKPSVKDAIEAIGIPHPEVKGIYVNGHPADFLYNIQAHDRVEVFPKEYGNRKTLNADHELQDKFILDVHLGKLAKDLRMLGFDSLYKNDFTDATIAAAANEENRIVLTRDLELLKNKLIKAGYWLRSQDSEEQLREVVSYFHLESKFKPFTVCRVCNGEIIEVPKEHITAQLPPKVRHYFHQFFKCKKCERIYWKGSHFEKMEKLIASLRNKES